MANTRKCAVCGTVTKKKDRTYCSIACFQSTGPKPYMKQRARPKTENRVWDLAKGSTSSLVKRGDAEFLAKMGWTKEEAKRKLAAYVKDTAYNAGAMDRWHRTITKV